jgi:hypothetical protein
LRTDARENDAAFEQDGQLRHGPSLWDLDRVVGLALVHDVEEDLDIASGRFQVDLVVEICRAG